MLLDYLDKVRERPLPARRRFAFTVSVVVTAVIAIVWGISLPARLSSLSIEGDMMAGSAGQDVFEQTTSENKDGLDDLMANIVDQSEIEVTPETRAQLEAAGFLTGGDGGGVIETGEATNTEATAAPRPVIIATSSITAATTTEP